MGTANKYQFSSFLTSAHECPFFYKEGTNILSWTFFDSLENSVNILHLAKLGGLEAEEFENNKYNNCSLEL